MATPKKKTTARKAVASKTKSQTGAGKKASPAGPREEAIANEALKLVDKAAGLLRKAIRESADTSRTTRLKAKHQAHSLLNKASSALSDALSESASTLHKVINKI
jgi:hypothetical protein